MMIHGWKAQVGQEVVKSEIWTLWSWLWELTKRLHKHELTEKTAPLRWHSKYWESNIWVCLLVFSDTIEDLQCQRETAIYEVLICSLSCPSLVLVQCYIFQFFSQLSLAPTSARDQTRMSSPKEGNRSRFYRIRLEKMIKMGPIT